MARHPDVMQAGAKGLTGEVRTDATELPGMSNLPDEGPTVGPVHLTPRTVAGFAAGSAMDPLTYVGPGLASGKGGQLGIQALLHGLGGLQGAELVGRDPDTGEVDPGRALAGLAAGLAVPHVPGLIGKGARGLGSEPVRTFVGDESGTLKMGAGAQRLREAAIKRRMASLVGNPETPEPKSSGVTPPPVEEKPRGYTAKDMEGPTDEEWEDYGGPVTPNTPKIDVDRDKNSPNQTQNNLQVMLQGTKEQQAEAANALRGRMFKTREGDVQVIELPESNITSNLYVQHLDGREQYMHASDLMGREIKPRPGEIGPPDYASAWNPQDPGPNPYAGRSYTSMSKEEDAAYSEWAQKKMRYDDAQGARTSSQGCCSGRVTNSPKCVTNQVLHRHRFSRDTGRRAESYDSSGCQAQVTGLHVEVWRSSGRGLSLRVGSRWPARGLSPVAWIRRQIRRGLHRCPDV